MQIVFLFYEGMTALDAIGPHEILSRLPNATVKRVALKAGLVHSDSADLQMVAEYALFDVDHADVLVIPGAGSATALREFPDIHDWIRLIHATTRLTTSVCTGSLILGAAGLLSGLRATSHWAAIERLSIFGAKPTKQRIVEDGKILTAAGVSAGIDMALAVTEKLAGKVTAQTLQLGIEYDPHPPYDVGSPEKANPEIVKALRHHFSTSFEQA